MTVSRTNHRGINADNLETIIASHVSRKKDSKGNLDLKTRKFEKERKTGVGFGVSSSGNLHRTLHTK